jgi:hypothetical protein
MNASVSPANARAALRIAIDNMVHPHVSYKTLDLRTNGQASSDRYKS